MTHVTCRLTAKNRDQLQNPTLGNRVRATFTFLVGLPMIRSPESVGLQGATRAGERQTHSGTTRKQTRNRRCGVVIIARWPHVSHTAFSYSTYSRRHVIGYRRRPASLWLVRQVKLIVTRAVGHLAVSTFQNDRWRHDLLPLRLDVVSLDICLLYVYVCGRTNDVRDVWNVFVDLSVMCSCQFFSGFNVPRILHSINVWQSCWKNKKVHVFGTQCTLIR